jgi:hypothetical protein
MMLGISNSSFHYKYYELLRKMWALDPQDDRQLSLCVYSQFIFWMTIVTTICSPLILMGWLILKSGRLFYKACSWTKIGRVITDGLDWLCGLGDKIDERSNNMIKSPAVYLVATTLQVLCVVIVVFLVVLLLSIGITAFVRIFMNIPEYLGGFLSCIALGIFYIFCGLGWCICQMFSGIWIGLKWLGMIAVMYATTVIFVAFMVALAAAVTLVVIKISLCFERVRQFLGFRINGFREARISAQKRKTELEKLRQQRQAELEEIRRKKEIGEIPLTGWEQVLASIGEMFCKFGTWLRRSAVSKTTQVKGGSVKVLGVFGILWNVVISLYHGVCPLLQVVDDKDIDYQELPSTKKEA